MTVFLVALGIALAYQSAPATWPGFTIAVSALIASGLFIDRAVRSQQWTVQHVVAIAAAAVLTRAALAFTYYPVIGEVSALRKYSHNAVFLTGVAAICVLALRASRERVARPSPEGSRTTDSARENHGI